MALAPLIKLTFVLAVAGSLLMLLVWTGLMALRLLYPDRELPFIDRYTRDRDVGDPVGVEDIQERRREEENSEEAYRYRGDEEDWLGDRTEAIPTGWAEDLWRRRN